MTTAAIILLIWFVIGIINAFRWSNDCGGPMTLIIVLLGPISNIIELIFLFVKVPGDEK